jgi:hypothetical protein
VAESKILGFGKAKCKPTLETHCVALAAQVGLFLQLFPNVDMILLIKNI